LVAAETQSFLQGVDASVGGEQRLRVDVEKALDPFCVELLMRQAALGVQTERICRRVNPRRLRGRSGSPLSPRRAIEVCFEGVQKRLIPFSISAQARASGFNSGENGANRGRCGRGRDGANRAGGRQDASFDDDPYLLPIRRVRRDGARGGGPLPAETPSSLPGHAASG
jgi:hypothetical protein